MYHLLLLTPHPSLLTNCTHPRDRNMYYLAILAFRDSAHTAPCHQLRQCDLAQEVIDLDTQIFPQIVGQTALIALTVLESATAGSIDTFIHRADHLGDGYGVGRTSQAITPTRAAH